MRRLLAVVIVLCFFATVPGARAQDFEVTSTPFRVDHTLSLGTAWNTYELSAGIDQRVAYSVTVTTAGACVMLLFVKGHGIRAFQSEYFATYSEDACVPSYSNTFPVEPADGTAFTVLIDTESAGEVDYRLAIDILSPVVPAWVIVLSVMAIIGLAPPALWVAWRRLVDGRSPPLKPVPGPSRSMDGETSDPPER